MGSSNACELQTSSRPVQNAEMWNTLWIILPSLQLDDCLPESGGRRQTLTQANRLQTAVSFQDPLTSVRVQGAKNHFHTV